MVEQKTIQINDTEEVYIFKSQPNEIEIDYWCGYDDGSSRLSLSAAQAREIAIYLIKLADEIEGK